MKNIFNVLALVLLLPVAAPAAASLQEPALAAKGDPVSPLCFTMANEGDTIDPQACDSALEATESDPSYPTSQGFYGTAYHFKDDPEALAAGYIEYRHLGETNGKEAIWVRDSSGGSGIFTTLYLLSRTDDDKLKVEQVVATGDRCINGIENAFIDETGALQYETNLTQQGIYNLAAESAEKTSEDTELENCAVCCIGRAHYKDGILQSITLSEENIATMQKGGEAAPIRQCFNRLLLSHQTKALEIRPGDLKAIVSEYHQTCRP